MSKRTHRASLRVSTNHYNLIENIKKDIGVDSCAAVLQFIVEEKLRKLNLSNNSKS